MPQTTALPAYDTPFLRRWFDILCDCSRALSWKGERAIDGAAAARQALTKPMTFVTSALAVEVTCETFPGVSGVGWGAGRRLTVAVARHWQEEAQASAGSSRLARVEVEFPNTDLALKPGMFVRIDVDLKRADDATLIPRKALVRHKDKDGVFWLDPAKPVVRFFPVKLGIRGPRLLQITAPVLSGQVVTMGYHLLKDKSKVTLGGAKKGRKGRKGRRRKAAPRRAR